MGICVVVRRIAGLLKKRRPRWNIDFDQGQRLTTTVLKLIRDLFDQKGVGITLIGMPGIERHRSPPAPAASSRRGEESGLHGQTALPPAKARCLAVVWPETDAMLPGSNELHLLQVAAQVADRDVRQVIVGLSGDAAGDLVGKA